MQLTQKCKRKEIVTEIQKNVNYLVFGNTKKNISS